MYQHIMLYLSPNVTFHNTKIITIQKTKQLFIIRIENGKSA